MQPVAIHLGTLVMVDSMGIRNAQVSIGATSDHSFARTAILCGCTRDESFDVISHEGLLLARINVHGYGPTPSIDVISDLPHTVETRERGRILSTVGYVPHPEDTTTMIVMRTLLGPPRR